MRACTLPENREELRREREATHAAEIELHRNPKTYRGRDVRWPPSEIRWGRPGPVRQSRQARI